MALHLKPRPNITLTEAIVPKRVALSIAAAIRDSKVDDEAKAEIGGRISLVFQTLSRGINCEEFIKACGIKNKPKAVAAAKAAPTTSEFRYSRGI